MGLLGCPGPVSEPQRSEPYYNTPARWATMQRNWFHLPTPGMNMRVKETGVKESGGRFAPAQPSIP